MECFTLPAGGLAELLNQPSASLRLEADLELEGADNGRPDLRYAVTVDASPATGKLAVGDEYLVRLKHDATSRALLRIERVGDHLVVRRLREAGQPRQDPVRLSHTLASNLRFSGEDRYSDFDYLREEVQAWRSYLEVVSGDPPADRDKHERNVYKRLMRDAIRSAWRRHLTKSPCGHTQCESRILASGHPLRHACRSLAARSLHPPQPCPSPTNAAS
jgi:hypothetical protein